MSEGVLEGSGGIEGLTPLETAVIGLTECLREAFPDLCTFGLTIGESYVPFDPDEEDECDEEETGCSQGWVRVTSVGLTEVPEAFGGRDGCAGTKEIGIEVGVIRCIAIPEGGEAPTATDVMVASLQAMDDMNTIYCAAMGCEAVEDLSVGQWTPLGPLGGQYGGIWSFIMGID